MDKINYKSLLKYLLPFLFALGIIWGLINRDSGTGERYNTVLNTETGTLADRSLQEYYQKQKEISEAQKPLPQKAVFLAVGDIMLSRNVADEIRKNNNPNLPFSKLSELFKSADFSFGNLESPIVPGKGISGGHSMVFAASEKNAGGLLENKFKILHLANNHALDQGEKGLFYTMDFLKKNNIEYIGVGKNQDEAWTYKTVKQNGIDICFLGASYASINDNGKTTNENVARLENIDKLKVASYKLKANCDFIIVSMHAGMEYTTKPNRAQMDFARAAIDFGADMVIGHHPHWVQTIEKYCPGDSQNLTEEYPGCPNPKYIFYSLGNFIFDQMWSQETREGLVLKIQISKPKTSNLQGSRTPAALDSIELIPVIIDNYSTPRPADETESEKILQKTGQSEKILR